jgi:cupin fold WbuC family metalloprotein
MLVLQRGAIDVLTFDPTGVVVSRSQLDQATPIVQIPVAAWHTCVVEGPDTVVVEIKPGPYRPSEFCDWAPEEGGKDVGEFMRWVTSAECGQEGKTEC